MIDKADLFVPRLPQDDIEIPGVGTVRVRGLSRHEAVVMQAQTGPGMSERKMLTFGLVNPMLTEDEAGRWQHASPAGELEPVTNRIAELSGMKLGADKTAYKSDGGQPDAGV